jgi:transposase
VKSSSLISNNAWFPTLARRDRHHGQSPCPHKVAGVREAIGATGAMLRYLPPYSPRSQSIEQSFAELKAHLRKAASDTPGMGQTNGNPL